MLCSAYEMGHLRGPRGHHRPAAGDAGQQSSLASGPGSTIPSSTSRSRRTAPTASAFTASPAIFAAAGLGRLKTPAVGAGRRALPLPDRGQARLDAEDRSLCPAFALRLVRGVHERPVARMDAAPARAPSACARSTRWSTSPTTSPSTAAGRCTCSTPRRSQGDLVVRRAQDGRDRARARRARRTRSTRGQCRHRRRRAASSPSPASWAAKHTGCDEATTDVLIESALWDPISIAPHRPRPRHRHRRALSLRARRRSRTSASPAPKLATRLVLGLCGGEPSRLVVGRRSRQAAPARRLPL